MGKPNEPKRPKRPRTIPPRRPVYRPEEESQEERRNKSLDEWRELVDERIGEAMQRGEFEDLPGKGKPQDLARNPFQPADQEMAHKLLQDNDLAPAWMADRNALLAEIQAWREEVRQEWSWLQEAFAAAEDEERQAALQAIWQGHIQRWEIYLKELNSRILDLNLTMPIWRMEVFHVRLDRELARMGFSRTLGEEG